MKTLRFTQPKKTKAPPQVMLIEKTGERFHLPVDPKQRRRAVAGLRKTYGTALSGPFTYETTQE